MASDATREELIDAIGSLVTNIGSAVLVVEEVGSRLVHEPSRRLVSKISDSLRSLQLEAQSLLTGPGHVSNPHSWVLKPGWYPIAFQVASRSEKVLLTVAANALRAVRTLCEGLLDEEWPREIERELSRQRGELGRMERDLTDMRGSLVAAQVPAW